MGIMRNNLVTKLSVVLLGTVALGFAIFTFVNTRRQVEIMRRTHERMAAALARSISAGLRNAMLSGSAMTVEELLRDAQTRVPDAEIHVYAASGARVFEPREPPLPGAQIEGFVRDALTASAPRVLPDGTGVSPLVNAERCRTCHDEGTLRGVLALGTADARVSVTNADEGGRVVADVVRVAFTQLMSAGHEKGVDALFEEIGRSTPGVRAISVLGVSGTVSFGDPSLAPITQHKRALTEKRPVVERDGASTRWVLPLENGPRCQNCHAPLPDMRGTLVVALDAPPTRETLLSATEVSLDHVMLSGLGRLVASFLDEAATTDGVGALSLYDSTGRVYHTTRGPAGHAPPLVERALSTRAPLLGNLPDPARPRLSYVEPLENDLACQRCHGAGKPLRGAIEVTLDTTRERQEQQALYVRGAAGAGGTILVVLLALYLGLRRTVLTPVLEIGAVADRVSEGNLDSMAPVRSTDEIGRLAVRINSMIDGLRKKLELGKFVSRETVMRVDSMHGEVIRGGARQRITVLFSDIRGFTAFSERHEPEEVVEMLNHYLTAQAEVVARHGGDIDKYVGDELMARFSGPDMEARAIRCGVEMVEAVRDLAGANGKKAFALAIGVGINAGEVVIGAMGSADRMDFTVIGDAVNVAARLCSAAQPGQVLVSVETARIVETVSGIELGPLAPLSLKGKREPLPVVSARRESEET